MLFVGQDLLCCDFEHWCWFVVELHDMGCDLTEHIPC